MTDFVIQLSVIKVKTEANVYEPFEEFVQQVGVKPLDDGSANVEDAKNVDVQVQFLYK